LKFVKVWHKQHLRHILRKKPYPTNLWLVISAAMLDAIFFKP